jgi:hypothetical protein
MSNLPLELAGITGAFVLAVAGLVGAAWMLTAEPDRTVALPAPPPAVVATRDTCRTAWALCTDNTDLVKNYDNWIDVQAGCSVASEDAAKYGRPKFSFGRFNEYRPGNDYPRTGIAFLVDTTGQYSNGFGAMVHARTSCTYDLRQKRVVDLKIEALR